MSTDLVKATEAKLTVARYLNSDNIKKYLESLLKERSGQFITSLVSLSNLTPGLQKCEPNSLMQCGLKAMSLNLPLDNNLGFAYAIPYKTTKNGVEVIEAQFQMGFRSYVQLAQRTGQYKAINVIDIRAGEIKAWDPFTEELELVLINDLEQREKQPVIGYAAVFELLNGFKKVSYWSKDRVTKHAKRFSKAFNFGPWKTDFDAMAKKTVIKELLSKWGPLSTEMQESIRFDQSVIKQGEDGTEYPEYIDAEYGVVEEKVAPPESNLEAEFKAQLEKEAQQEAMKFGGGTADAPKS